MNCIFICIFNNENYIKLFYLLLESIYIYGNLDENTKLVVYTSTPFMEIIKQSHLYNNNIIFEINDTYNTIDTACKARLDLFQLPSITKFDKILYVDTDIIIKNDMNPLFSTIEEDILYVLEEGTIDHPMDCWGKTLFGDEINNYDDKTAFTSGILLFNNCEKIRNLFIKIKQDIIDRPYNFECYDQPYIVYNAFKYNLYNKVLLKSFAINNDTDIYSDKIIHHFPGGPGIYEKKLDIMQQFLNSCKHNETKITPILFQTSKLKPDKYIVDLINLQLDNTIWKYEFYDDNDILDFFINNPIDELPNIIDKFNAITSGAHKADLFRYYFLYLKGGFFMDSDAMIYENIESIIKDYQFISVNSSVHPMSIFQGILGCSPKNKIIKEALWQAYNTDPRLLQSDYHYWCKQLYTILQNNSFNYNIKLFRERRISNTYDEIINDTDTILFKHFWKTKVILYDDILSSEFTNIYKNDLWLSGSGAGSFKENTIEYNEFIINFIKNNNINSITDIGCGDWQSSHLIYNQLTNIDYLGIDCVDFVIQQNKEKYPNYKFSSMNILNNLDSIRNSEIYILKDILQHWTIKDIYSLIDKLLSKKFKCIIITNNANQNSDNLELNSVVSGRGLHSNYLPLRKYNAIPILDYYGGENKHLCIIQNNYTNWNEYNKEQINNFDYRVLTSYEIPNKLIRVGPKEDGGYIIADGLKYDLFISCGIANDIRFEEAFLDMYKTKCYAFDGTISQFPYHTNNIEWIPKNIGYINTKKTTNLQEYIKNNHNIFLKMDIEGSEFNWIDSLSIEDLYRFSQIVIEFHWPFDIYRMNMLKKLNETHYIIHIHGNNYCDRDIPKGLPSGRSYDGTANINNTDLQQISLPEVFEVTYINKKCFNETSVINKKEIKYPINLDYPNNPNAPDIAFSIPLE
jgi:hypothetical protein